MNQKRKFVLSFFMSFVAITTFGQNIVQQEKVEVLPNGVTVYSSKGYESNKSETTKTTGETTVQSINDLSIDGCNELLSILNLKIEAHGGQKTNETMEYFNQKTLVMERIKALSKEN